MSQRITIGFVGPTAIDQCRSKWNTFLREQGSACEFQFYKTKSIEDMELRLSEMFVLDRKGYVLDESFQESVLPLLDDLDDSAKKSEKIDTVVNDAGRLIGYYCNERVTSGMPKRLALFS